ncbi:MAG: alpha/beta hydrolase [Pleurocapsa minor GSE-CHR-MK-17-07R]|nr:alpha/beta hydrolase [Pleurocapsa minor GSE-CHR-MK 17-07R]
MMAVAELELIHTPPASPSADRPPLLFVHGAWHGAWCWRTHFMPWFAAHGWDCHAFSLRGHGDSGGRDQLRWASAGDYVSDLAQVVRQMPAPPVLVAHSMGGYVAQRFLLEADLPVAGLALLASVPAHGALLLVLRMLAYAPLDIVRVVATLSTRDVVARPTRARHWLFSEDIDDEALLPVLPMIQDESFRVLLDTLVLRLPAPKRARAAHPHLPMLVLGGGDDRVFSAGEMRALAAAYRAECVILPGCAHDLMLDTRWQSAADALASWLGRCFG